MLFNDISVMQAYHWKSREGKNAKEPKIVANSPCRAEYSELNKLRKFPERVDVPNLGVADRFLPRPLLYSTFVCRWTNRSKLIAVSVDAEMC